MTCVVTKCSIFAASRIGRTIWLRRSFLTTPPKYCANCCKVAF